MDSGAMTTELALVRAGLENHIKVDEAATRRIEATGEEIKGIVRDLSKDMKAAVERIHSRIDEEAGKARDLANDAANIARAETKIAIGLAQDAHTRVDGTKVWILTGVIAGLMALLGLAVEFIRGAK
jgi:hypothetical protein